MQRTKRKRRKRTPAVKQQHSNGNGQMPVGVVHHIDDVQPSQNGEKQIAVQPKIYLNGFPKSGLHLATLMARAMVKELASTDSPWAGSFKLNAWSTEWMPDAKTFANLSRLRGNTWLKGHLGYKAEFEQYLFRHGVSMAFIYRDLRDVLVSQSYHVIAEKDEKFFHPGKDVFRDMPDQEARILACLNGIGPYAGLFERWSLYAPWLVVPWVFKLPYEAMREHKEETAREYIKYVYERLGAAHLAKIDIPDDIFEKMLEQVLHSMEQKQNSPTFRKGIVGGWREEPGFTERVKDEFKKKGNDWLIRLGYEKDDNW